MDWQWAVGLVFTFLGGVGFYQLVATLLKWRGGNYAIDKTKRTDAIAEYQEIIARQRVTINDLEADADKRDGQLDEKTRQHTDCLLRMARFEVWADHVCAAASQAGIAIRPLPEFNAKPGGTS